VTDTTAEGQPAAQSQADAAHPAETGAQAAAQAALQSYFDALAAGDARGAAALLSNYSLTAVSTQREAAAAQLQDQLAAGTAWSKLAVLGSQVDGDATLLLNLSYTLTTRDAQTQKTSDAQVEEWWPLRNENGAWRVNWQRVIEFRGLDLSAQSTGGLTVNPVQMRRYPERVELVLFVQNRTNEAIVLGQPNETLASFSFDGSPVDAEAARLIFERQKTYPQVVITVKGGFSTFPERVEIRKWKNYQTAPWFTFELGM
jgi:hypothetical protein